MNPASRSSMETAAWVRHHRQRLGLGQRQIAEVLGVKQQAVSSWECGQVVPSREHVCQLASLFGASAPPSGPAVAPIESIPRLRLVGAGDSTETDTRHTESLLERFRAEVLEPRTRTGEALSASEIHFLREVGTTLYHVEWCSP